MDYEVVIGLEVHAQLKTNTKIFCGCSTTFGGEANSHGCPICLGHPGVLPVLNKTAVDYAIKMALATNCIINETSIFARKNYFYPDLPKGYQISQFDKPLCENGYLDIEIDGEIKRLGITRIHMEEDAGKLKHESGDGSLFDVNRAGTPLIEIVSEPDMRSAQEAYEYLKKIKQILLYLDICDGNMEEGSMRCDANISLRPFGQKEFGTRTELKNLNSFKNVEKALMYEIERQEIALENGDKIFQQTLLWDANKQIAKPMRSKEDAHDYRYFPDPDLVPLVVSKDKIKQTRKELPELPDAKKKRFEKDYSLNSYDADVLCSTKTLADYFDELVKDFNDYKMAANWMMNELLAVIKEKNILIEDFIVRPKQVSALLEFVKSGKISLKIAKVVFKEMVETGEDSKKIIEKKGLVQIDSDDQLLPIIDEIIASSPKEAKQYLEGKTKMISYFIGQLMKKTKGKANPKKANELFAKRINEKKDEIG